jgi:creatinine amidohydrolase
MRRDAKFLEQLTWMEAQAVLTPDAIVVIPLGAAAKEHGPHLPLNNDWTIAEYLKRRVARADAVVVAPTVAYHHYPAFVEYPGSVSLRLETARDLIVDICASLAAFGPRRYYVLNTGVSTVRALEQAAQALAPQGLLLRYTDIHAVGRGAVENVREQDGGTHADEIETSMMLFIAPQSVDMNKAVRDYHPGQGRLTRRAGAAGVYSPTGIYGDATLASWSKGRSVVEAIVSGILADLEALRAAALPPCS